MRILRMSFIKHSEILQTLKISQSLPDYHMTTSSKLKPYQKQSSVWED